MTAKDFTLWTKQLYDAKSALLPRPAIPYLVNPLLTTPSLNLIYGISGSLKTNLVIDLAVSIATGTAWLDGLEGENIKPHIVTQSPILWIDADSGQYALHQRFGAMLRSHDGNIKTPIHYASFLSPAFSAVDIGAINSIIKLIKERDVKLVVFDNLGTISGGQDENSSAMIQVMNNLRYISEQTKSAVVVIHHDPKNDGGGRKTPRGHSSIEAALDLALYVQRESDVLTISPTKTRGAPVETFSAFWKWEQNERTTDLQWAKFYGVDLQTDSMTIKIQHSITKRLKDSEATQSELVAACASDNIAKNKCLTEIQKMAHQHKIKAIANQSHNRTVYRLSSGKLAI